MQQDGNYFSGDYLVQKGADINARDDQGWLPLFLAARFGNIDVAEFLLKQHKATEG